MYIVDGELVDTYGGDYTYRYVYADVDFDGITFTEYETGAKAVDEFIVDDPEDIALYMEMYNRMKDEA
jgi:hypothetical protein